MVHSTTFFPSAAVHQIGYATTDVAEAVRRYRERCGVSRLLLPPNTVSTISPGRTATIDVPMALVKSAMIELVEPVGGDDVIYRELLPTSGFAVRQRHIGYAALTDAGWGATRCRCPNQSPATVQNPPQVPARTEAC